MGRGRRPNLALEPTRALQTQRAFRQRKAEHLASLEETVRSLSSENALLRKQLSLPPGERCLSPFTSPKGTPDGGKVEACEKCTAAAVEVQELRQSLGGLNELLELHGIAAPEGGGRKRFKVDHQEEGVNMTSQYFTSATGSPAAEQLARRPPPLPSAAAASGWHTPSPSVSAQTPPQGFSPRAHQAYSAYTSPMEEAYRRPPPPQPPARSASASGSRGHLPPPSPAARYWSGTSGSASTSPGGRPHALPAYASPSYGRRYDDQVAVQQGYEESPRSRMAALQDEGRYGKRACGRGDEGAAKSCCPPPSSSGSNGSGETKSSCGTSNTSVAPPSERGSNWSAPPPLGVSFDMRATGTPGKEELTSTTTPAEATGDVKLDELKEDECCFGLVKCDSEGRIII